MEGINKFIALVLIVVTVLNFAQPGIAATAEATISNRKIMLPSDARTSASILKTLADASNAYTSASTLKSLLGAPNACSDYLCSPGGDCDTLLGCDCNKITWRCF